MTKGLKKVLIVDDEETLTWSMAKSLSKDKDKYEVLIANNGKEAFNHLKKEKIDLVISDIGCQTSMASIFSLRSRKTTLRQRLSS